MVSENYSQYSAANMQEKLDSLERSNENQQSFLQLPPGVTLDTLIYTDSITNISIYSFVPVSGISSLDASVKSLIDKERVHFLEYAHKTFERDTTLRAFGGEFTLEIQSVHRDEQIISYLFMISVYHAGMANPFMEYHTYNFDLRKNKRITFQGYFSFDTKADTTFIIDQINTALDLDGASLSRLNDIDFCVTEKAIWLCFDDHEISNYVEGVFRATIPRQDLNRYIRPAYK
jgi:hypothetical protein